MSPARHPVVVFFAFANDRVDEEYSLRNLPEEQRRVRAAMAAAERAGLCEIVERANAMVAEVLDVFQDARYRDRVAIFHFGGHAGSASLLFESPEGAATPAYAEGFARFLGEQHGLELVFLNGCSSQGHVQGLLDNGVHMVIATSEEIDDEVATEFSSRFYSSMASGVVLRTAYAEAAAAVATSNLMLAQEPWPWDLYVLPGAEERARRWSLPSAAHDPLFGLPPLPALDLPASPFKHLAAFTRDDAAIFFGRGREIRELFKAVTLPDGEPVVLLFGATGVGKSSLLAAGLEPRLEARYEVLYLRREKTLGLAGTLARALAGGKDSAPGEATDLGAAWRQREGSSGKLVVILDQIEETWTRSLAGGTEVQGFAGALRSLFAVRQNRPRGRLVLGFRKEWLADVRRLLEAETLPFNQVEVGHPDREGIAEAVAGLASSDRLQRKYHLKVDHELPAMVADDLLADPGATIAPVLQILLTKMWAQETTARPPRFPPRFTVELYQDMKRQGILLDDFIGEQLRGLREWRPEVVDTGLVLDLLAFHTTPLGTAETRVATEVDQRYGGRREVVELLDECRNRYLLIGAVRPQEPAPQPIPNGPAGSGLEPDRRTSRLAHDTLAPLVRRRFEASGLPGQLALRILQQRAVEWPAGRTGVPLDDFDLVRVEEGESGMRSRTPDEERLVVASRQQVDRRKRQRRNRWRAAAAAGTVIFGLALWALWQRSQALTSEERSRGRADAAIAANLFADEPTKAGLLLLEIPQPDSTPTASHLLNETLPEVWELATLLGHTGAVEAASFSPDGTRVVTASADKTARLWNAATGQPIAILIGHMKRLQAASFSRDGTLVVTASDDGTARIWSAATGQPISILKGHVNTVNAASFSPNGTLVVTASDDGTARIWNAASGQTIAILKGHINVVNAASFSPAGTLVVTASKDNTARIWSATTGHSIATLEGHTLSVNAASFSPDGTWVATASDDGTARIWSAATGQPIAILNGHTSEVQTAFFSPDGTHRVVTASGDGTARIWNAVTGQPIATLKGHTNRVRAASFSRDGTRVVTASWDKTARIWNAATGKPIATLKGNTEWVSAASFSPDGTRVLTASADQTARIWNTATGQPIIATLTHQDFVKAASFSPDGTRVVTASDDHTARIWDAATGQPIATLSHEDRVWVASFSPDGTRVAASEDKTARIWNASTGQPIATLKGHTREVDAASFSPDGTLIVTASVDATARIWNAATGDPIATLKGHTNGVTSASFSPDGTQVITASWDHTARIWNVATGQSIARLKGHTDGLYAASFSPDGTLVVTASDDGTAWIWSAATGQPIAILKGHANRVNAASFSPDGTLVLTGSGDGTARIWSAATGEPIAVLKGHTSQLEAASFSPDGTRALTASMDNTARIWSAAGEYLQSRLRAQTRLCLRAEFRRVRLGESAHEANVHERGCEACVPKLFARLQNVPAGNSQTYLAAWKDYRRCFEAAR